MFHEKRILVTGGSRGIGWATAKAFFDAGARVAVNGRTGESTSAGIERLGGGERLIAAPGDVVNPVGGKTPQLEVTQVTGHPPLHEGCQCSIGPG